jgi:hypothetical protein
VTSYEGRRGRTEVSYTDRSTGRTVLHETYSRDGNSLTRHYYDRYQNSRAYQYERAAYRNTYVYVYQPVYVWYDSYWFYRPFCSHGFYSTYWSYNWWWFNDPWFGYYGYYYRPYPRYIYPSEWLVDYYWSSLLADEYQDRVDAGTIASQQNTIAAQQAEIDALKAQLKKQIDDEMLARSKGDTLSLDVKLLDPARVYVMSTSINVVTTDATPITCGLTSGDVISLAKEGVAADGKTATMMVRSAKAGNCAAGAKILISIEQLQEFENEFNRRLDLGAEKMKEDPAVSSLLRDPEEAVF